MRDGHGTGFSLGAGDLVRTAAVGRSNAVRVAGWGRSGGAAARQLVQQSQQLGAVRRLAQVEVAAGEDPEVEGLPRVPGPFAGLLDRGVEGRWGLLVPVHVPGSQLDHAR